jgi:hypothetical protein
VYSDFYEIPLPALRFEKTEETDIKWMIQVNDTEERNNAFQTTRRNNDIRRKRMTLTKLTVHSKNLRIKCRKDDAQRNDASEIDNDTQKNVKTRKKNDAQKLADHSKDLKNHRSLNKRI